MTASRERPTLDQVAARAGVGRGTVSRVINGSSQVSERTRQTVLAAVTELGYVPTLAARALVTRRTDTVALVVSESEDRLFGEPFFAGVVRAISAGVTAAGRQLVLALTAGQDGERPLERYLTRQHVDGVLLLSLHAHDDLVSTLDARGVPTVCGGSVVGSEPSCVVDVDNRSGGRAAVAHLLAAGRRRVAVLTGPQDMSSGRDRLTGAHEAVAAAGLDREGLLVAFGDYSEASGERAMRDVLAAGGAPDAVFAASDLMAVGALRVLREAGLRVPDDVALVGFDDSAVCGHTEPALTSLHQPVEGMGAVMADLLLARIAGVPTPSRTVLPTHLVVRASG